MTETGFIWFLLASMVAAVIHSLLPNHWLPIVAVGRYHKWTSAQLFRWALLLASSHAATTVGLGVVVVFLGESATHFLHENSTKVAGIVLMILAAIFFLSPRLYGHRHIHHPECEHCQSGSQVVTLTGLFLALTLSPCEGLLLFLFAAATKLGWIKTLLIALVNSLLTIALLVTVSLLAYKGWERFLPRLKEHHERLIVSGLLMAIGVALVFGISH
ncbi:MAG: hypothetical protein ACUVTP_11385 [Candidatus Fervidibacter sp.]|uniref:hypothetical protein n=1 Tax=Candidatus Fervidibacter sp. TaxID=3100871 RepID=UPI00404918D3